MSPGVAGLLRESEDERLERMAHHARLLAERGYLRPGVTVAQATDVLWACGSAELYALLVMQRGWSLGRFAGFIADFMTSGLLDPA